MINHDLALLTQADLAAFPEIAFQTKLWSIQRQISTALSVPRAKVAVSSCNASGKSHIAGAMALAFYYAFPDAKVITTSATEKQLKDVLWGEIRRHYASSRVPIPGKLYPGDLRLQDGTHHYVLGNTPTSAEAFQGHHTGHKLIIVDEAAAMSEEIASGILGLLASGDARLLLVFNPTHDDTWAAQMFRSPDFAPITISAFNTPHFTGEPIPPNSNLITPAFLEGLKAQGMGPGTMEWTNRVEGRFWSAAETQLILGVWYERALKENSPRVGRVTMGVDLAPYGTDECTIAVREGNRLISIQAYPSMRPDHFWSGVVRPQVEKYNPDLVIYDADGVGAGSIGDAERACGSQRIMPFRGAISAGTTHRNIRSLWWWSLRQRFEQGDIVLANHDPKLQQQLTQIRYSITDRGAIAIETKEQMRRRGLGSPDRADAVMYAFSMDMVVPKPLGPRPFTEEAVWEKVERRTLKRKGGRNPYGRVLRSR